METSLKVAKKKSGQLLIHPVVLHSFGPGNFLQGAPGVLRHPELPALREQLLSVLPEGLQYSGRAVSSRIYIMSPKANM
jgi:hypothetical protein